MKFAVVFALLMVSATIATDSSNGAHRWGDIMTSLAEVQAMAGGPIDDLLGAINDVLGDLANKQSSADSAYQTRSYEHDQDTRRIQGEIDQANIDIANTISLLESVLYVQRDSLNEDVAENQQNIQDNINDINTLTNDRNLAHNEFLDVQSELQSGISAIDEALGLLISLQSNGDEDEFTQLSLVQVGEFHKMIINIDNKLGKSAESALVKSLLNMKSEEFADKDAVRQVQNLLLGVQSNLQDSLANAQASDAQDGEDYQNEVKAKTNENVGFQLQIYKDQTQLVITTSQIEYNEQYLSIRKFDLIGWTNDLQAENDSFDTDTQFYEELTTEISNETDACNQAAAVLQNSSFASEINDRLNGKQGAGLAKGGRSVNF